MAKYSGKSKSSETYYKDGKSLEIPFVSPVYNYVANGTKKIAKNVKKMKIFSR